MMHEVCFVRTPPPQISRKSYKRKTMLLILVQYTLYLEINNILITLLMLTCTIGQNYIQLVGSVIFVQNIALFYINIYDPKFTSYTSMVLKISIFTCESIKFVKHKHISYSCCLTF